MPQDNLNVREKYLEQIVESSSREGLLLLLVDGAVKFVRQAQTALEKEKLDEVNECLVKAQNIFIELVVSLDIDSGEFALNIANIYQYIYNLLIEANMEKSAEKIGIALGLSEQVRDLWKDAIENMKGAEGIDKARKSGVEIIIPVPQAAKRESGLYEPVGNVRIVKSESPVEESPKRLNITG